MLGMDIPFFIRNDHDLYRVVGLFSRPYAGLLFSFFKIKYFYTCKRYTSSAFLLIKSEAVARASAQHGGW